MEPDKRRVSFADDPIIIKFERALDEQLKDLWWTKEERTDFKAVRTNLFNEAVKKYQNHVYRNTMRELRIDMLTYTHMSEEEKQETREYFIDKIQQLAYDNFVKDDFRKSEFYAEYKQNLEKGGGKKSRTTRKKRRTRRRRQKRTRRHSANK